MNDETEGKPLTTVIERVCVFRQGAIVTRRVAVPAGTQRARLTGLPLCLDDGSVRVEVDGGVHATSLRVTLEASGAEHGPNLAPAEDEELGRAQLAVERCRAELLLLNERIETWKKLSIPPRALRRDEPPGPSPHQARLALADLRRARLETLHRQLIDATERGGKLEKRLHVLLERQRRETTARERAEHELRKCVDVELDAAPAGPVQLRVSYEVPGARWAPSYVLRIDESAGEARLELRAIVAQRTGEDWSAVTLELSTASPTRFVDVPELRARRIGRAQTRARDRGWRPSPADTATLLDDFERARRHLAPPSEDDAGASGKADALAQSGGMPVMRAMAPPGPAAAPAPPLPPSGAPPQAETIAEAPLSIAEDAFVLPAMARGGGFFGGGGQMVKARSVQAERIDSAEPAPLIPDEAWLDYQRLRLPSPRETHGQLAPAALAQLYLETIDVEMSVIRVVVQRAAADAEAVDDLGARYTAPIPEDAYDHAYGSEALVDVPADGGFHSVPVRSASTPLEVSLVVVPRASTDAYRQGELDNPLLGPLLPGPIDVYVGLDFLTSTRVRFTPPGGKLRLGLGVAQGLKVARNARFNESSAGLMGGSLVLHHDVDIEIASHLERPQAVEVRERLPVLPDKEDDIKLTLRDVAPAWEAYDPPDEDLRGGHRWRFQIAPKETRRLHFGYDIRIASKNELLGGNRREDG